MVASLPHRAPATGPVVSQVRRIVRIASPRHGECFPSMRCGGHRAARGDAPPAIRPRGLTSVATVWEEKEYETSEFVRERGGSGARSWGSVDGLRAGRHDAPNDFATASARYEGSNGYRS